MISDFSYFYVFSEKRQDEKVLCLLKSEGGEDLKFHQKCLNKYSHRKMLTKILRDRSIEQEKGEESAKKARLSVPPLRRTSFHRKSLSGTLISY